MQGILDYAELRKDITFQERGFNPVDALIFSVLSYVDWEEVVNEAERPLSEACALFLQRREGADFARIFAYSPLIPRLLELLKDAAKINEHGEPKPEPKVYTLADGREVAGSWNYHHHLMARPDSRDVQKAKLLLQDILEDYYLTGDGVPNPSRSCYKSIS